jgi:hypothetical protein
MSTALSTEDPGMERMEKGQVNAGKAHKPERGKGLGKSRRFEHLGAIS